MSRSRLLLALALLLAAAAGVTAWWWLRPAAPADDDPRLSYPTPYRNVRPEVRYVGDDACAACHAKQTGHYREHPMGRSLAPAAAMAGVEKYGPEANPSFRRDGLIFTASLRNNRLVHAVREADGAEAIEVEVRYAVGSGTRGRTYLVERDGCLFQSPISWYSLKGTWDLTPGLSADEQFERPARPECLYCHANAFAPAADSINRYEAPFFRGHSIGCERCHGPGELHVAARSRGDVVEGLDTTIVNPARLEPALRDGVCAQCHLQGEVRVLRRGRELFDYRPGLPLELFVSAFLRHPGLSDGPTVGGHVEQVRASRCYQGSGGQLGCTSCHDPHRAPAAAEKVAHYRAACLKCHSEKGCAMPAGERRKQSAADSCIDCHMPRGESRIAHTAIADHHIPRRPGPRPAAAPPGPGESPLLLFGAPGGAPRDDEEARDLALALATVGRNYPALGRGVGTLALPRLDAALARRPDDLAAREARGFLLWQLGRREKGMEDLNAVLEAAPRREAALGYAAVLAAAMGRGDDAVAHWRRAIDISPAAASYRARLAKLLADREDWAAAREQAAAALRLNPFNREAREVRSRAAAKSPLQ